MDIKIITIHSMHNPGSVFQAYALQQYLNKNNEATIIDYRPDYLYTENAQWKLILKKLLYGKAYKSRSRKFNSFISNNMMLTDRYNSYDEINKAQLTADVFVTGSDQLWNSDFPCGNDDAFYLSFVHDSKKIAYSTSVGKKEIDEHNRQILREKLKDFNSISVREKSTAEFLSAYLERDVSWVCDPVFLLPQDHYQQFISENRVLEEPYVVVYMSAASDVLSAIVDYYRSKGMKIVLAGGFTKRCYCDLHIKDVGPEDFLNLIYKSESVVSSSFHATAFCHVFHKDFITLIPKKNGERIINLLDVSNLRNRGIDESFSTEAIEQEIDWELVDSNISKHVRMSVDYLNKALEE